MSARVRPSATASLPEMRSSFSSEAAWAAGVATAIVISLDRLVLRVLAWDAGRDLHTAAVEVLLQLFLVLAPEAEAVRARRRGLVRDLGDQPGLVGALVLAPHLPLAGV